MSEFVPDRNMVAVVEEASTEGLMAVAELVVERAKARAPYRTGAYRNSLQAAQDRGRVRAETVDPFGHLVEWGSVNNAAYAPLRFGASDVGRFEPE